MAKFVDRCINRLIKLPIVVSVLFITGFMAYASVQNTRQPSDRICSRGTTIAKTELLFGLSKADGSSVTEAEFQTFINQEVTPRFPDGLTLMNATGQFKTSKNVIIKEKTKLLLLLHQSDRKNHAEIEQIRKSYVQRFQQESVLRTDEQSCASF